MVLDTGTFEATVLTAVVLAGAARTVIPYLSKRQGDISSGIDPRPFSISYIITAILGVVPVAVGAILLLPTILPQVQNGGSQLMVFITAFGLAYATTDLVNRNVSTLTLQTPLAPTTKRTKTNLRVATDVNAQQQSDLATRKE